MLDARPVPRIIERMVYCVKRANVPLPVTIRGHDAAPALPHGDRATAAGTGSVEQPHAPDVAVHAASPQSNSVSGSASSSVTTGSGVCSNTAFPAAMRMHHSQPGTGLG
jgi:hypothetical protein